MLNTTRAPKRAKKRRYSRWGELIPIVARITGLSHSHIYGVLRKHAKSARVREAVDQARREIAQLKRTAA